MGFDENDPVYAKLLKKFLSIGLVVPGTLRETYLLCGKKDCVCATKDGPRHGPYYLWNRKVNGKLTAKSIPKDKVRLLETWIENRRELEALVSEVIDCGQKIAAAIRSDEDGRNSKKRASAKRGK